MHEIFLKFRVCNCFRRKLIAELVASCQTWQSRLPKVSALFFDYKLLLWWKITCCLTPRLSRLATHSHFWSIEMQKLWCFRREHFHLLPHRRGTIFRDFLDGIREIKDPRFLFFRKLTIKLNSAEAIAPSVNFCISSFVNIDCESSTGNKSNILFDIRANFFRERRLTNSIAWLEPIGNWIDITKIIIC